MSSIQSYSQKVSHFPFERLLNFKIQRKISILKNRRKISILKSKEKFQFQNRKKVFKDVEQSQRSCTISNSQSQKSKLKLKAHAMCLKASQNAFR